MTTPHLTVEEEPTADEVRFLEDRLYDFNVAATGIADGRLLAIFVRDVAQQIVGAVCGHTWGGCCEIRQLWIDEPQRRQGLGKALMEAVEHEARKRGCFQILLSTHSFQAPAFYERLGFGEVSRITDYPRGHAQIFYRKRLGAGQ